MRSETSSFWSDRGLHSEGFIGVGVELLLQRLDGRVYLGDREIGTCQVDCPTLEEGLGHGQHCMVVDLSRILGVESPRADWDSCPWPWDWPMMGWPELLKS